MAKRALITGVTGQDGSYLAELLLEKGYEVFGVIRRLSASNSWRIDHIVDRITLVQADLLDQLSLIKAVERADPHEFYNLAAMSFVPASWDQPMLTGEFNSQGVTRALEAIRRGTEFVSEWRKGYRARRDRLVAGLIGAGFELEPPRAALYLFPKTPAWLGADSRAAAKTLLDGARVATVPGIVFGPEGEGHLRFSFSVSDEMIAGGVEALATYAGASASATPGRR